MVSSAAICHAGTAEPCLRAVHGAVRAAAAWRDGGLRTVRESLRDHPHREARASHGAYRRAPHARCVACGDRARIGSARAEGLAEENSRRGEWPEVLAKSLALPPHSPAVWLEVLGVHFRRRSAFR